MTSLRVLVACEFSGTVRDAFLARGHDAWSCDLLPDENGSNRHITGDARAILEGGWDLLIVAHPPCTRLCNSGVRWLSVPPPGRTAAEMHADLRAGADLFSAFWNAPIERIAVENPVMHRHAKALIRNYAEPAQSVQPWQFGHGETKRTCLWLRSLPALTATQIVAGREQRVFRMPPGPDRWRERSRFFPGIASGDGRPVGRRCDGADRGGGGMTVLQAAAVLTLWRSGLFDTHDIAVVLGGVSEADVCRVLDAVRRRERPDMHLVKEASE